MAVAIASTVVLVLGGCASSAGSAPSAQPIEPAALGLVAPGNGRTEPGAAIPADGWRGFGEATLTELVERRRSST